MELGETMELGDRRDSQLGEEDSPFIVEEQIQPLSTNSAYNARYYHTEDVVLSPGPAVLPQGTAVLPPTQQYPKKS